MKKHLSPNTNPRKGQKAYRSKNMSMLDNYYGNSAGNKSSSMTGRTTFYSTQKDSSNKFKKVKNPEVQIKNTEIKAMLFPMF